jgi:type I restriction enzyme S subunit
LRQEWAECTLGDTCEIYQPKTISAKEMMSDGQYPVFGANGIIGRYDQFNHTDPQLLITCRSATCGAVNISLPKSWITGNAMVVRPRSTELSVRFVEYFFRGAVDFSKVITGSAQPQITRQSLAPVKISFPPLPEQQRIVAILDEAFAGLATATTNAEKNLKNARELFDNYLNSVFAKGRGAWREAQLADTCKYLNGTAHEQYIDKNGRFIVINSKFISSRGEVIKRSNRPLSLLEPGSSAMVLSDVPNGGALARCYLVDKPDCYTLNQRICSIRSDNFDPRFLYYQLNRNRHFLAFDNGENQTNLRRNQVLSCPLLIPAISEQKSIAAKLDVALQETQHLEFQYQNKLNALSELKSSILKKAFGGELEPSHRVSIKEAAE